MGYSETFTAKEILEQLDNATKEFRFPMLDNGYTYPVSTRLSAYRNSAEWKIVIEEIGFHYRAAGHAGIWNCLSIYGNSLDHKPGHDNANFLHFTADSEEGETFDTETESFLNPGVSSMLIRGQKIILSQDPDFYGSKGIQLEEPGKIMIWEMMRGLMPEYRDLFIATEEELRARVPEELALFIRLDEWHHPDLANQERPGQNETFIMLADALETGDLKLFKPTLPANTHWSNWPEGGTL